MLEGLRGAIRQANDDASIRAVVITNEGSTFCAGANLKQQSGQKKPVKGGGGFVELLEEIQTSAKPIVGRIDGHVVGGGNGLASALDISIAREDVKFGFTEVRIGVIPEIISVVCLPKMRQGDAMEAFLRGNRFSGARAAELGLINRAVPGDQLDAAVHAPVHEPVDRGASVDAVSVDLQDGVTHFDQRLAVGGGAVGNDVRDGHG